MNKNKKRLVGLALLFLIGSILWISLTAFENNKDRILFIALFFLFIGLVALGAFLKKGKKE